jgi:hypothetical protein
LGFYRLEDMDEALREKLKVMVNKNTNLVIDDDDGSFK